VINFVNDRITDTNGWHGGDKSLPLDVFSASTRKLIRASKEQFGIVFGEKLACTGILQVV
jgi:hypothetical protein